MEGKFTTATEVSCGMTASFSVTSVTRPSVPSDPIKSPDDRKINYPTHPSDCWLTGEKSMLTPPKGAEKLASSEEPPEYGIIGILYFDR
ncbi:hypothetical protein KC333_g91 [Hortaea werneckii]|nr:hypothetical protein KC333_g91 [Hortaea werneckii]